MSRRPRKAAVDRGRSARGQRSRRAFTLLELLVVMVIIAITAGLLLPYVTGTSDLQVLSAARVVAADIQYAQNAAVTGQTPVTVTFNPGAKTYTLSNASGPLNHPMTKGAYVVDFVTERGFQQLQFVTVNFGGTYIVTFDETGAPNHEGYLRLQAGPHVCQVDVAAATGRVTVTMLGS